MQWLKNLRNNLSDLINVVFHRRQLSGAVLQQAAIERAEEELKILHADFVAAVKFFKENYKSHHNLPLYLVVGQTSFGKTTLLAKSGMDLHDIYGDKVRNEFSTKYCVWLFSLQAIFLDTAGIYTHASKEDLHANLVWLGFLSLLHGHFLHNQLRGTIVVIDIPTLAGPKDALRKNLSNIKERLYEVARYVENLPIFVVFTKVDLIDGFVECFADWSLEERKQSFGITFAKKDGYVNPQTNFIAEFSSLLQLLQVRLSARFHREEDAIKRIKIQNFLLQFAQLRTAIAEVINGIPYGGGRIELYGLYFVSGLQNGESNDYLMHQLQSALQLPLTNDYVSTLSSMDDSRSESYFVEDLFKQELLASKTDSKLKGSEMSWSQFIAVLVLSLLLGAVSLLWYRGYTSSVEILNSANAMLQDKAQPDYVLRLEQTLKYLEGEEVTKGIYLGLGQVKQYAVSLQEIYYKKIVADFVSRLQKILEEEITTTGSTDYKYLYDTLKTYLMLSNPKQINHDFVQAWFDRYWQKTSVFPDATKSQQLSMQLKVILQHGVKISPSEQIVATAREMLNSYNVPKEDLVYTKLENMYGNKSPLLFKFGDKEIRVAKLYTAHDFNTVYQKYIPEIVDSFSRKGSDWVLAGSGKIIIAQSEMDKLIASLRALYIKNYVEIWDGALQQIKIAKFNDLAKMSGFLTAVKNDNYQLLPFLRELQHSLMISNAPPEFIQAADVKLIGWRSADLSAIHTALANLSDDLSKITASADVNKAVFKAAAARFVAADHGIDAISNLRKIALRQPKIAREWLQSIADDSWQSLLIGAQNYIKVMWAATVGPEYKKLISNNYPFFKSAPNSISVADLAKFFAINGVMDSFFNNYLRPFVDTDQVYWVLKNVDGQRLGITEEQLEIFIRATLIRKMFYPNGGNTPEVKFSLMAQSLTPGTQRFNLNLGGQVVSHIKQQKEINHLVWPGSNPGLLHLEFIDDFGKTTASSKSQDVWSWFRLLDRSNIKVVDKTQRFSFTIDLNGNAVKYDMYAEQPINPFIPEIINNFRCPEKL